MNANWNPKKWTADEDAVLMRMRERGFSFGEIAVKLPGRTRNMVAGRVDRLGLCKKRSVLEPLFRT